MSELNEISKMYGELLEKVATNNILTERDMVIIGLVVAIIDEDKDAVRVASSLAETSGMSKDELAIINYLVALMKAKKISSLNSVDESTTTCRCC